MEGGRNKTKTDKVLEKLPPLLGYSLILFPIVMSIIDPVIAAGFIIIVNVYFFYKSLATCVQFATSLLRLRSAEQIDWKEKAEGLKNIPAEIIRLTEEQKVVRQFDFKDYQKQEIEMYKKLKSKSFLAKNEKWPMFVQKILFERFKHKTIKFLEKEIKILRSLENKPVINPDELQHIIIVPHVKEPLALLRETLLKIQNQTFNTKQINIVLAAEAKDPNGVKVSEELKAEFGQYFNHIWITNHVLQPDDIIGKSANMLWATTHVYEEIKKLGWDLKKTTITSCDADSKFNPQHFSYLTYLYCTTPEFEYKLYAGPLVFYNNIWRLPFYARVKNSFSSIFNVAKLVRTDKFIPISTYSLSFWMAKEIGFWTPWVTPEDYHIFFKCLFKFKEKVSTIPMYCVVMSDAAEGDSHLTTIMNNYKQSRRWAWGISDTGWMIKNLLHNIRTDFSPKVVYITSHVIFDHITGPTIAVLILLGGNLPVIINPAFADQVTGATLPQVSKMIVRLTVIFMVLIVLMDFYFRPRPEKHPWWKKILSLLEWFAQPVAGFLLAALPGLEAQTRLIFGKYLEYYVTKKKGSEKEVITEQPSTTT